MDKTQTQIEMAELQDLLNKAHNLAYRLKLDADAMRLVELVRQQEVRIEELEQSSAESWREHAILKDKLGDLYYQFDEIDPLEILWFLEDIGIDAYHLPRTLWERTTIRDAIETTKVLR